MSSIFSRIIAREIPSYTIYEDDLVYAFLDIHPIQPGHILLIPKTEHSHIEALPDDLYVHMMKIAKNTLIPAIKNATQCVRVGMMVEGFGVPDHAHLHLIPLHQSGDLQPEKWHAATSEELAQMTEKILQFVI